LNTPCLFYIFLYIFGSNGDEVHGEPRRLNTGELNDLHNPPNIIQGPIKDKLDERDVWYLGGEDRSLGQLRRVWGNNIKMEIEELGVEAWTGLI